MTVCVQSVGQVKGAARGRAKRLQRKMFSRAAPQHAARRQTVTTYAATAFDGGASS